MTGIVERLVALANSLGGDDEDAIMAGVVEIERLQATVTRLMAQPTNHPLEMTPDERKELWAAHEEARRALEPK